MYDLYDNSIISSSLRHQRNKLKLDDVPKLPEWQRLRYQHTSSNDMSVPNLVIRRASVVQGPMGLHNLISEKNFSCKYSKLLFGIHIGILCTTIPIYFPINWMQIGNLCCSLKF